jgi:hypothetical protein
MFLGGEGQPEHKADNLTAISVSRLSKENVGASTSRNPMGLHGLLQGNLYLFTKREWSTAHPSHLFPEVEPPVLIGW